MGRRKKYNLIIDTETSSNSQIVYNIGYMVVDNHHNIVEEREFYVREIFGNALIRKYIPETNFFNPKANPTGSNTVEFWKICVDILNLQKKYHIKEIYAYNSQFDKRVMKNTFDLLYPNSKYPLNKALEWKCIWNMACQVICRTKHYKNFCKDHNFISKFGNYVTNAEVVYRFLINNPEFKEEHLALADVHIEAFIFWECLRKHKKLNRNSIGSPWRMVQD